MCLQAAELRLVVQAGFVVDDGRVRRLQRRARQLGFADLRGYLQARCDSGHSVPGLARELGESEWTVTQALATLGIVLPPRAERGWRGSDAAMPRSGSPRGWRSLASQIGVPIWPIGTSSGGGCWPMSQRSFPRTVGRSGG